MRKAHFLLRPSTYFIALVVAQVREVAFFTFILGLPVASVKGPWEVVRAMVSQADLGTAYPEPVGLSSVETATFLVLISAARFITSPALALFVNNAIYTAVDCNFMAAITRYFLRANGGCYSGAFQAFCLRGKALEKPYALVGTTRGSVPPSRFIPQEIP